MKFVKNIWKKFVLRIKTFFGINAEESKTDGSQPTMETASNAIALDNLPRNLASASSFSALATKTIIPWAKGNGVCKTFALALKHFVSLSLAHLGFKSASAKIAATSATAFGSACLGIGVFVVCFGLFVLLAPHAGPAIVASKTASLAHDIYNSSVAAWQS